MIDATLADGTVHKLTDDLRADILADKRVVDLWQSLTPLARNEWICWVENAKHLETRNKRIARVSSELLDGMHRPCCWIGCIHRTDKAISPSVRAILDRKQSKKSNTQR